MSPTASDSNAISVPPPKPHRKKPGRAVVIHDVDWKTYSRLLRAFGDRPRLRLTYDRGVLEIMVPSNEHEADADFLAALVVILTKGFKLPVRRGGSTTLRRMKVKKGLEPDRCFWIASAAKMVGVRQLDLRIHPPPDLAIEVDVTRSSLDRFGIYSKLGVPELWRLSGDALQFHTLGGNRRYVAIAASRIFTGIAPDDLMTFVLQSRNVVDQNATTDSFEVWLRQRLAAGSSSAPPPTTS
jgi:Uma2 family endonuclease